MYVMDSKLPKYLRSVSDNIVRGFIPYLEDIKDINVTKRREAIAIDAVNCFLFNARYFVKNNKEYVPITLKKEHYSKPLIYNGRVVRSKKVSFAYSKHLFNYLDTIGCTLVKGKLLEWDYNKETRQMVVHKSESSKIILSDELYNTIREVIPNNENITLKSVIEIRDSSGEVITKRLTPKQKEAMQLLNSYNEKILRTDLTIDDSYFNIQLKKIYLHSSFECGGRNYVVGESSNEVLNKVKRKKLLIDGEPTVELDFANLYPRILADMEGVVLPKGFDPYEIEMSGFDDKKLFREVCKKGLLIALNCGDMVRASAALASSLSDASIKDRIKKAKDKGTFPTVMRCKQILEKLVEHNGYLLNHIHSGIGHELTNIESQIMDIIIESILMEGEVLIPIHDSVIVVESFKDKAEAIMYNAYDVVVGGENSIVTCKVGEV